MNNLSIIIPAQSETESIQRVISEAKKLIPHEIIVVANGCTDRTIDLLSTLDCKVIQFPHPLDNDVSRAVRTYHSEGEILLFLDGDIVVSTEELLPGALPIRPHITTVAKIAVNWIMNRIQSVNSLLAIPHPISRKTIDLIGFRNLADPRNRLRPIHFTNHVNSPFAISTDQIIGDHLAAIHHLITQKGPRGGYHDGCKNRRILQNISTPKRLLKAKRSAVIPVMQEKDTILEVIESVRLAGVDEIIVIANGSDSQTMEIAVKEGAIVIPFSSPLGHNVGRAIGAAISTGEVCLFVDGDFPIQPSDLVPFIHAVENGVDVAVNDFQSLLDQFHPLDIVSAIKYFLNLSVKRPDLLNNSLTAVPHAIHRRVIDSIGFDKLMIPPLAQVHAQLAGYNIQAVHYVDVIKPNHHQITAAQTSSFDRITGDHLEALHYLFQVTNSRGGFSDGKRFRDILTTLRMNGG